jgi:hypothetical protein
MSSIPITAFFSESGAPKLALTPTIDIWRLSDNSLVVNDGAMTEVGGGWYKYTYEPAVANDVNHSWIVDGGVAMAANERYKFGNNGVDLDGKLDRNADLIESQRGHHTWQNGQWFYVDPVNGDTIANGATGSRTAPLSTVTEALSLTTDSQHTVIMLLAGAAAGVTTLDEPVTVNKRYTFIRGPGRDFIWKRTTNGDTIVVTAEGVELSGFQVETHTTGSGRGIYANGGAFLHVHNVWVNQTRGSGIGTSDHCLISDVHISDVPGDGVRLTGGNVTDCMIAHSEMHGCTGWGVNVGAGVNETVIRDNALGNNTLGDINNEGTGTVQKNNEQYAKNADMVRVLGLTQDNFMLDEQTYDSEGLLLTGRVRIFASAGALAAASAGNADNADGEIARYNIGPVVAATPGRPTDFRVAREL